jgi:hemoglobin-like flavoprotein
MNAKERQIVRESFSLIKEMSIPVSLLFYGRLFDLDPSLRHLFHIDMREQSRKLMDMLEAIVNNIDDLDRIVPALRELGQRHVAYGVKDEHYDTLCTALVWAFGQALQPGYNSEVRDAWNKALQAVSKQMKIGATMNAPTGGDAVRSPYPERQ